MKIPARTMYARIPLFDRAWYLRDLVRLSEGLNYSMRMIRAGVPDKVRRKILLRWTSPFSFAWRREARAMLKDTQR